MSAWTQLIEPGPALIVLVLILAPQISIAAPFENTESSEIEYYPVADATGCYYNFEHYDEGDRIITNEPCLNCTCHNRMLMCYLRVCPFTKAIGQNCKVEKKPDQCCPVITCPEVPVALVPHASTTPSTEVGHPNEYGCSIDNLFYSDGAKVPSNPDNPCEVCYCIRNKTACIIQECTLTGEIVAGCRPVYVDGVCCPVRYDCEHPELETTPRPLLTTTTTTLPPTSSPTDCIYNNEVYVDGALLKKDVPCEQCYCMKGDIVCAVQECGPTPLDKVNCTALPTKQGQCCPDSYECDNISEEDLTTLSYYETPTTQPTIFSPEDVSTVSNEEVATRVTTPHVSLSDETVVQTEPTISTQPEESAPTESATAETFTSKITEAVEAVTSKVTDIVEAITSTITGTERDETTQPEVDAGKEIETSSLPVVTEEAAQTTEKQTTIIEIEPENATEQKTVPTEGYSQVTKVPPSDEQKILTTELETKLPITTEISTKTDEIPSMKPESVIEPIEHVAQDENEEHDEELPYEEENEIIEGSGKPPTDQQQVTVAPEEATEDRHTRPIDQTKTEEPDFTELPVIASTQPEKLLHEEITEGSGLYEIGSTVPSQSQTAEIEKQSLTTEQPSDLTTESFVPEEIEKYITEENIIPQQCDKEGCQPIPSATESIPSQTIQPIEPGQVPTEMYASGGETTVSEEEKSETVTKQPDETTAEIETEYPEGETTEGPKEISPAGHTEVPSATTTELTSVTEVKKEVETAITTDQKPTKEETATVTTEEVEEMDYVTQISQKETEKPQSMDHVSETIPPGLQTETQTEDSMKPTESPKISEAEEKPTEPPTTEKEPSRTPEIAVPCNEQDGCVPGHVDTNEIPAVVEECTKESCGSRGEIPQSEISTETNVIPEGPIACTSEADCAPSTGQEVVTEPVAHLPLCEGQYGCEPSTTEEDKLHEKPICDPKLGCAPGKEAEETLPCSKEEGCISGTSQKGEIPKESSFESCQSGSDCPIPTEGVPEIAAPNATVSPHDTTLYTGKPEEVSLETETTTSSQLTEQQTRVSEKTENEEMTTPGTKPEVETEQSHTSEKSTEPFTTISEEQPETTPAPEYEVTSVTQQFIANETDSPLLHSASPVSEEVTTESKEHTTLPSGVAHIPKEGETVEEPGGTAASEVPSEKVPEGTEIPEVTKPTPFNQEVVTETGSPGYTEVTEKSIPEVSTEQIPSESTSSEKLSPVTTASESTEKTADESTKAPEQLASESTQSITEVEVTEAVITSTPALEINIPEITESHKPATQITEKTETPQLVRETTEIPDITERIQPSVVPTEQEHTERAPEQFTSGELGSSETTKLPEVTEPTSVPESLEHVSESEEPIVTEMFDEHTEQIQSEFTTNLGIIESEPTQEPEISIAITTETTRASAETETEGFEVTLEPEEEHGIPGEGNCLVDGQTYKNNSIVPPINQCQISCKCVSSILQCESVACSSPPVNMENCVPTFHSPDSCCPTYSCSVPAETGMESDSHVVETTTATLEDEKLLTTRTEQIASEGTTSEPAITTISSSGASLTTIKQNEEPDVTTISEVPEENITELTTELTTTTKKEPAEIIPGESITTEGSMPEIEMTTAISKEGMIPESRPTTATEIPEHGVVRDEVELEITEEPIILEQCGTEGCKPTPVEESSTEKESELEEQATTQPGKQSEVPVTEETITTAKSIIELYTTLAPSDESSEGELTEIPAVTEFAKGDEISTFNVIPGETITESSKEEHPIEIEPIKTEGPLVKQEESTEQISAQTSSYDVTESLTEASKSPEEIAFEPEIEEAATSPTILPESITESERSEIERETISPESDQNISTTESKFTSAGGTEQSTVSVKQESETIEPDVTPQDLITKGPVIKEVSSERQTETTYPGEATTTGPIRIGTTDFQGSAEVTESVVVSTGKLEAADHVTESIEPEEFVTSVTEHNIPENITQEQQQVQTTESQKEGEPEEVFTTALPIEHETAKINESIPTEQVPSEITTISSEYGKVTEPVETEEKETVSSVGETTVTSEGVTEKGVKITEPQEEPFPTHAPVELSTDHTTPEIHDDTKEGVTSTSIPIEAEKLDGSTETSVTLSSAGVSQTQTEEEIYTSPELTTQPSSNVSGLYTSGPYEEPSTRRPVAGELSTSVPLTPIPAEPSTSTSTFAPAPVPGHDITAEQVPDYHATPDDYEYEDQGPVGPGTCRYGGKVYVSAQQIPRDDPCDFCFCFRSDIICLQQSCPPPIPKCHEEPIRGFCCPRYECPVGMAATINVTTSTTTTTTTLPPHFLSHAYKGRVKRAGCQIRGKAYRVGDEIRSASGPCLHCTCGGDGEMQCDPKVCSPEPMLRQMITAATSRRRR